MNARRVLAAALLGVTATLGAAGCSGSSNANSGAVTNLDEVGPQIARLRAEVDALQVEIRALRKQVAASTPSTTAPLR